MAAATTAVIAVGSSIGAASSIASSGSSSAGMWALVNQYQLFLLFPYLRSYMPADLQFYLTEFSLFSFDFEFLDLVELPIIETQVFQLNYTLTDPTFVENGMNSASFVINQYNFFKAMLLMGILNIIFIILFYSCSKYRKEGKLMKLFNWFIPFFYLSTYLRMILEGFLFNFLATFLETTMVNTMNQNIISYSIAFFFTVLMMSLPMFIYFHFQKYNSDNSIKDSSLVSEIYSGTAEKKSSKLYMIAFLLRRILTIF